jgi:hypothetical protein
MNKGLMTLKTQENKLIQFPIELESSYSSAQNLAPLLLKIALKSGDTRNRISESINQQCSKNRRTNK